MLMDLTTEGVTRIGEITSDGLVFSVTHVAYGSDGYNLGTPALPLALNPADTTLGTEVFRKTVPQGNTVLETIQLPRGRESTYTTVGGDEFTGVLGEAGLIATVSDPGTTGLAIGYEFLLAHAHFGRIVLSVFNRLAIKWPIDFSIPVPVGPSCPADLGLVDCSNVYVGNMSITNDAQMAQFLVDGYDGIDGYLEIDGSVTTTAGLANLLVVNGDIYVFYLSSLTSLDLPDLRRVNGYVFIIGNSVLTSVSMPSLRHVTDDLQIGPNDAWTNMDGLCACLGNVGEFSVVCNNVVTMENAFTSLSETTVGDFILADGDVLTSIAGSFSALTTIAADLAVFDNALLTNVDALSSITTIGGDLVVSNNLALTNIRTGFGDITGSTVTQLNVAGNPVLPTVAQAQGLESDLIATGYVGVSNISGNGPG